MKRIDEIKAQLEDAKAQAQEFLNANSVAEAKAKMEEVKALKEAITLQEQLDAEQVEDVQNKIEQKQIEKKDELKMENVKNSANTVRAMIKKGMGRKLTEAENALLIPATLPGAGTDGVGLLLPQDINTAINVKVRQYKSFRDVLGYIPTTAMSGSFVVENFETLSELIDFTDGNDGTEPTDIKFTNVTFQLKEKGAILKLSNTLLNMADQDLINYVVEVFAKKAVITENKMAIAKLQAGKTVKTVADWKALKKSINVDLDEGVKYGVSIVTNQDGFDVLDSALDTTGRPVLQPNPSNPTQKLFMGYPVQVFSNALLPTTGTTTKYAPLFYGNLSEAVKFVDNGSYSFAVSEHAGFNSNTTVARVIEYVDVTQIDSSDKIYIAGQLSV